ncbi:MAG: hypothetical protein H7A34_06535 [bacterium]|nr:hypothetical protein [bacterium]
MIDILKNLIAGGLFSALKEFFNCLKHYFHCVPNMSGKWKIYYSLQDDNQVGELNIKINYSKKIKGSAKIYRNRKEDSVDRELIFKGSLHGCQVLGFYEDLNLRGQIVGCILVQFKGEDRDRIVYAGKAMYCNPNQNDINVNDICIKKAR